MKTVILFIIENVEPGEYILSVRQVGFEKNETKKIVIDEKNQMVELNTVILKESNIQLEELEVVAAKKNKTIAKN